MCVCVCVCVCVLIYRLSQEGHKKLLMIMAPLGNRNEGKIYYSLYVLSYFSNFVQCRYMTHSKINKWTIRITYKSKKEIEDFPGGTVVKNPPANAGDTGSSPGPGRSHRPQINCAPQLYPCNHNYWVCVPQLLKPMCLEPCSAAREVTTVRRLRISTKSSPCLPQLEKARTQQQRPSADKNK